MIPDKELQKIEKLGTPIRVGLVGAGYAARGIALQLNRTPGMKIAALCNRTIERAHKLIEDCGVNTIKENILVTDDYTLLCRSPQIDVIVEATGDVEFGAHVAWESIHNFKHTIVINAELDCTIGPILKQYADRAGVIYSQADGDQPAVIMNLFRYVKLLGFTPLVAGNIKTVFDRYRTPETQKKWAGEHNQSPRLATTAVDGTKLAMEMATVANATGFKTRKRGMYGPTCKSVDEALQLFPLENLLKNGGIVDYILGAQPSFGIFVIAHSDNPMTQKYMNMYKMGKGPFYTFYRPYHLCALESHLSVARAVLNHDAAIAPIGRPICDVVTIAKRDLKAGEKLDGIGGFTSYGILENYDISIKENLLPMGLSEGCILLKDIPKDRVIGYNDVTLPEGRLSDTLRKKQTELFK